MKPLFILPMLLCCAFFCCAQQDTADVDAVRRMVNLSEVVVRSDLNVPKFLQRIKYDTTFYKAFKNLRILGFTSLNDIRMLDKKGNATAMLQSKTRQNRAAGCRTMDVLEEKVTGDIYDNDHHLNYFTADLYSSLFFTTGQVCNESNIVQGITHSAANKKGMAKHKEQLKMLFFNPGQKIQGIPFMGDKLDIFDEKLAPYYDYTIDAADVNGQACYLFTIKSREGLSAGEKSNLVFDNITTWFDTKTLAIVARNYDLSYNAGLYDFDVHIEVVMTTFNGLLVPQVLRYKGNWDVAFKKRERGVFTATLFNFNNGL